MHRKLTLFGLLGAALLTLSMTVPVLARDGDISKSGDCTGNATWKLTGGLRDGRIEVEFEVDQNRVGKPWRVRLTDNGDVFYLAIRTTQAPSGSFTVQDSTFNHAGTDQIVARATNLWSGQVCRAVISL
jgi:hypothetical protein